MKANTISYNVTTDVVGGRLIAQTVDMVGPSMRERVIRNVLDTQDAQIREALIKLGWTPPG